MAESESISADVYGKSSWFQETEQRFAEYLGQEAAVFFPTGAMAQQLAMRYHCEKKNVNVFAMHPTCQMELNEHNAYSRLHGLAAFLVGHDEKLLLADNLKCIDSSVSALAIELPMRQLGGETPDKEQLRDLIEGARNLGLAIHLDAARTIEVCPYYETTPRELASSFDSVYLSCYKGLGAMGGAILAGTREMVDWMLPWRRRHGGEMKLMTPYLLTAANNLGAHLGRAEAWWRQAKMAASIFNCIQGVSTRPAIPKSFLFHIDFLFREDEVLAARDLVLKRTGVWLFDYVFTPRPGHPAMTEITIQSAASTISDDLMVHAIGEFGDTLANTLLSA